MPLQQNYPERRIKWMKTKKTFKTIWSSEKEQSKIDYNNIEIHIIMNFI